MNLRRINLAQNLTIDMSNFGNTIKELQTTKNFEPFLNFTNPTVCDYFSYRMTMLEFEITLANIKKNVTKLYQDSRDGTRQISVFTVMRHVGNLYREYFDFYWVDTSKFGLHQISL